MYIHIYIYPLYMCHPGIGALRETTPANPGAGGSGRQRPWGKGRMIAAPVIVESGMAQKNCK